jgi:hypothetical protein
MGTGGGGLLNFGFGRDVPLENLKSTDGYTNIPRNFDPSIYLNPNFSAKLWSDLQNFTKISPKFD